MPCQYDPASKCTTTTLNKYMKNAHFVLWVCKFFKSDLLDNFQRRDISQNNFFDAEKGRLQISAVARHDPCKQKQTTAKI